MSGTGCEELRGKTIGVLRGGRSGERSVSLRSGGRVLDSLLRQGFQAVGIDVGRDVADQLREAGVEVAVVMLHGRWGEDGTIQGLLEQLEIPYTGSRVLASALSMDKLLSKALFASHGILTPRWATVPRDGCAGDWPARLESLLPYPVVLKPRAEGSSLGVHIIHGRGELEEILPLELKQFGELFVEEYVPGASVTVGILGTGEQARALPILELVPRKEFYDYEAKYTPGMTEFVCPARLPVDIYREAQEAALKAHRVLGCRGFSRVDMQVSGDGRPYTLEVNTIPGMTDLSDLPAEARAGGMSYDELVLEILKSALEP